MPAIKVIKRTVELGGNTESSSFPDPIPPYFFNNETAAHTFLICARQNGQPFLFAANAEVTACFLNDNDQIVPPIIGSIVDGAACVTLTDACYHVPGSFTLTISVSGAVVYECCGTIKCRSSETAYDPTRVIPNLQEIQAEVAAMREATDAAEAAANVDIDMIPGVNEVTIRITRPNGVIKTQNIQSVMDDGYDDMKKVLVGITKEEMGYKAIDSWDPFTDVNCYYLNGNGYQGGQYWRVTPLIPCYGFHAMQFYLNQYHFGDVILATVAFFDENGNWIKGIYAPDASVHDSQYKGQCAIPDDARYFKALGKLNYASEYTPEVILYKNSVDVEFTNAELRANTDVWDRAAGDWQHSLPNLYRTKNVPTNGFKSFTFHSYGFNGKYVPTQTVMSLENVTFLDESGTRIGGVFANISDGNLRYRTGTAPIPANAAFLSLTYNAHNAYSSEILSLTLHNSEETPVNILCIGDSITEGALGNNVFTEDNYVNNMQKFLGVGFTSFNAGVGGANASTYYTLNPANNTGNYKSRIDLSNIDVVIIMLGLNGNMEPGFFENDGDPDNPDDVRDYPIAAYTCKLIEWVWSIRPEALVVIASPTYSGDVTYGHEAASETQTTLIPELVKRYHIPFIDIHNIMGINKKNYTTWLSSDKVHGTLAFYHKLGMAMANGLRNILNIDAGDA